MSKRPIFALAIVAALAAAVSVQSQESSPSPAKALPRVDKAEAAVVGTVVDVGPIDRLRDGRKFRILQVRTTQSVTQVVPVVCAGSLVNACGRLVPGRRASFLGDFIVDELGQGTTFAKRLQKAVPRTDKAEVTAIGPVEYVDHLHNFPDGTPYRALGVLPAKPFPQRIGGFCIGPELADRCAQPVRGQRVSFTGEIRLFPDNTAWVEIKRLQT